MITIIFINLWYLLKTRGFINFRRGWQNSPGGGKIAPAYGTEFILSCHLGIYELLLCVIWVRHAYNVMINFGTCAENVT